MASFPPMRLKPSKPVSTSIALSLLQTYLALSARKENAHLLPNATLTPTGPVAKGDASSNLTIHNLKRVEAGLRGEWLAPTIELEGEAASGVEGTLEGASREVEREGEGWQDLGEYQREQSIEIGEVGPENTEVGQEPEEMIDTELDVVERVKEAEIVDKEARRRAKKERMKAERKKRVLKTTKK